MADIQVCNVKAPHETHNWVGLAPGVAGFQYHHCPGKVWNNFEVRTHLAELIQTALEDIPTWELGQLPPYLQITEKLWPRIVGFVQSEDGVPTVTGGNPDFVTEWKVNRDPLMVIPPTSSERIAEVLEYLRDRIPICDHVNIQALCPSCRTINLGG
jgi:hypothetical protein